jgi:acyl-CoA thioesterase-1
MNPKMLSIITVLVVFGVSILYFAMHKNQPQISQVNTPIPVQTTNKKIIIAAFGDSLTAGYGGSLEDSYPSILEKKLSDEGIQVTIINMGVSGETTTGGKERVQFVLAQKPDIVMLGLGANDMLRLLSPTDAKANLETIIQGLQKSNTKIVLLGMKSVPTNGVAYTKEFDAIYPDLAKKYNLPLIPFFLEGVAFDSTLNTADGIHPNRQGYEKIINNNILPILLPYIKKNF